MNKLNVFKLNSDYLLKVLTLFFVFNLLSCSVFAATTCKYLIPNSYNGWVRIYTGIKNTAATPISDNKLIYTFEVAADGKLITSTSTAFDSGMEFYYYNDKEIIRIPLSDSDEKSLIHGYKRGSYSTSCVFAEDKADNDCQRLEYSYHRFYVGTYEQYQEENKKIKDRFEFLKKNLYADLKEYIQPLQP